jgi:hypothetical protein
VVFFRLWSFGFGHFSRPLDSPVPTVYLCLVQIAFKEWAIIVDALGRGEQIIILRKGGVREGCSGFRIEHPRFLLFPTLFHQQCGSVIPAAQARFDQIAPAFPPSDQVQLRLFAEVSDSRRLDSPAQAERLRGQHIWQDRVIAQRFDWGPDKAIYALAVRVFRLPAVADLPMRPGYAGCRSWVELEVAVPIEGSAPVLDEEEFAVKLNAFRAALAAGGSTANSVAGSELAVSSSTARGGAA